MVDKSKSSMLNAVKILCSLLPDKVFQTFTSDRGKEFSYYKDIEKMGIDFYFADPFPILLGNEVLMRIEMVFLGSIILKRPI